GRPGREPRAEEGGRGRVPALGAVGPPALPAVARAAPGAGAPPRGRRRRGHGWPDLPGRSLRADRPRQRRVPPPPDRRRLESLDRRRSDPRLAGARSSARPRPAANPPATGAGPVAPGP